MVHVAIDAGPLYGPRTGIGNAVQWTFDALDGLPAPQRVDLRPYVISTRAAIRSPHRRLPMPALAAHRLWSRSSRPPIDRLLRSPDVVHGTNYVVPPTRCARVVSVYDCWFLDHPDDAHPDVRRAGEVLRRSIADGAHVVASSTATADRLGELFTTDRVHTILLGPPPVQSQTSSTARPPAVRPPAVLSGDVLADDAPVVVAIGTVERRKNLPMLIAAFARLAAEHETVHLVVAGRAGDDSPALLGATEGLERPVRDRVHVIGPIDETARRWLLGRATCLAYPSLDEGFGFPVLEAQMAGTPVVASSAGSIPEVAGNGALFSLPTDPVALAANLFGVVTDESRRSGLIEAGHRNLERFSWETTARGLAALYRDLAT